MQIQNIAFSGGGFGGIAYIGVLKVLEEQCDILFNVKNYSGCSIGAVFATLISLGYTAAELTLVVQHFRYQDMQDLQLLGLLENLGLDTGKHLVDLLGRLIAHKAGTAGLTFEEHWVLTGRGLYINASCVEKDANEYFMWQTHPHMPVLTAIRMSIAIPPLLSAVKFAGYTYIDGGLHEPFPIGIFPPKTTLGFRLLNESLPIVDIHPFITHMYTILRSLYRRINYTIIGNYTIIDIKTGTTTLNVNMSQADRRNSIRLGYESFKKDLFKIK